MTPAESCGLAVVSVTSSHHVSQSQQWFVLPMHHPPIAICPSNPLPLAQIQYVPLLAHKPKVGEMKARNIWQHFSWLKAMWRNHNYICGGGGRGWGGVSLFSPFLPNQSTHQHLSSRLYMCFCFLLTTEWRTEKVPSVVCLMTGFLSSNHTEVAPRRSRQPPSAGHCQGKHHFSTHTIIFWSWQPSYFILEMPCGVDVELRSIKSALYTRVPFRAIS